MKSVSQILFGLLLIAIGLYLLVPGSWLGIGDKGFGIGLNLEWGDDFLTVLKGCFPVVLLMLGVLIILTRE
ncbi:MAG: hypothetical protein ACOC5L_04720 [Halobacteriota archaeon]